MAEILSRSAAALGHVHSFRLQGIGTNLDGSKLALSGEFELPGRLQLELTQGLESIGVIVVGQDAYVKANRAFWLTHAPAAAKVLTDHWVKLGQASAPGISRFLAWSNPKTIGHCVVESHLGSLSLAGATVFRRHPTVVVVDHGDAPGSEPGKLYVARVGPPLPLHGTQTGPQKPGGAPDRVCGETTALQSTTSSSEFTLTDYNKPVSISPPRGVIDPGGQAGNSV